MNWLLHLPLLLKFAVFGTAVLVLAVFMVRPTLVDWFGVMKLRKQTKRYGTTSQIEQSKTAAGNRKPALRKYENNQRLPCAEDDKPVEKGPVFGLAKQYKMALRAFRGSRSADE